MYSALCPACGNAIYGQVSGSVAVTCATCHWSGRVAFHFLPNGQSGGAKGIVGAMPLGVPFQQFQTMLGASGPDDTQPDPLEARREALWSRFHRIAGMTYELLRTVDTEDWQMPAWRRYERLQEAYSALYTALGGVRMGDYHPARAALDERLASVLLWALLTLDGVER